MTPSIVRCIYSKTKRLHTTNVDANSMPCVFVAADVTGAKTGTSIVGIVIGAFVVVEPVGDTKGDEMGTSVGELNNGDDVDVAIGALLGASVTVRTGKKLGEAES